MTAVLKNEITKLAGKKKYLVLFIIAILICGGRVGVNQIISRLSGEAIKTSNIIMEMFPFFAEIYVPLIVFMAVTDLVSTEICDLTIKATLMRPVSRFKVVSAKIIASFLMGTVFYAGVFVSCAILQAVFGSVDLAYISKSLGAYIIDLVPLFVLTLFANMINLLSKTPTLSMFLSIVAYALMKYCNYFSPMLNTMFFTSYMQWHKLWIGAMIPFGALSVKIGIITGSAVLLYTAGYMLFDKKEY